MAKVDMTEYDIGDEELATLRLGALEAAIGAQSTTTHPYQVEKRVLLAEADAYFEWLIAPFRFGGEEEDGL